MKNFFIGVVLISVFVAGAYFGIKAYNEVRGMVLEAEIAIDAMKAVEAGIKSDMGGVKADVEKIVTALGKFKIPFLQEPPEQPVVVGDAF